MSAAVAAAKGVVAQVENLPRDSLSSPKGNDILVDVWGGEK